MLRGWPLGQRSYSYRERCSDMPEPICAYRFQFTPDDDFARATSLVPYLKQLGVSHLYMSPIAEAVPGSQHGYDVVDPTRIRAELGGEEGFAELIRTLDFNGIGWIVDIVPNHVSSAVPVANPWFWDVLTYGRSSAHAPAFDIDWDAADGKMILPTLDRSVPEAIADGVIERSHDETGNSILLLWGSVPLPLWPGSDLDAPLDQLLGQQHYRLAHWKSAARNVRRFFEIDSLVAVRVEDPSVRAASHTLLTRLLQDYPSMSGVRVDHVDGLADPGGYLRWLRQLVGSKRILLVEKILLGDERLPQDWPVDGTTGYEFARLVDRVLLNGAGFEQVQRDYVELTGDDRSFHHIEREAIREVLRDRLAPDVRRIATLLALRFDSVEAATEAIVGVASAFDRYRTYLPQSGADNDDLAVMAAAGERARLNRSDDDAAMIDRLVDLMSAPTDEVERRALQLFQQLTGPALAKGVEDRAIYRYIPLGALNEVGGSAVSPPAGPQEFHRWAATEALPRTMLTTSTHDTKRSGDVRARLLALADHPTEWRAFCDHWFHFGSSAVDPVDRYVALQHAVGAWPVSVDRLTDYMRKALREGAERTSWIDQDDRYEATIEAFITDLLSEDDFVQSVEVLLAVLAPEARSNSLAQALLRLTAPGFADLYRGDEMLDLSLVDPDNRRILDWDALRSAAAESAQLTVDEALERSWSAAKMALIQRTLSVRATSGGPDYEPLEVGDGVLAFRRGDLVTVVVSNVVSERRTEVSMVLPPGDWRDVLSDGPRLEGRVHLVSILHPTLRIALLQRLPRSAAI